MNLKDIDRPNLNNLVLILGFSGFISAANSWFVSPVLPAISNSFGTSIAQAGIILTAYMIPYGIMQPVYGFFSDQYSKLKTLKIIVYGLAVGTFGCALSQSLYLLSILRVFTGFFAAGIIAISLGFIGDLVPNAYRQIYIGKFMAIVSLGQGISAVLGGLFATFLNWRIAFFFFGLIAIVAAVLLHKLQDQVPVSTHNNFLRELKFVIASPKGKIIFPLALITGLLLLGIYGYIGSFLNSELGLNYLQSGLIVMFFGISSLLASTQVGKSIQRFGRFGTVLLGSCFGLCSAMLLALSPSWQTVLLATITLGFGCIFVQSTLAAVAFEISSESTGLSSGLIGLCIFGGGGIGTAFSGLILSGEGFGNLWQFYSFGIFCFIILQVLFYLYSAFQKKKSQR
ncbi:MFS transporter [Sporolactobacillus laevolacticus]|uniref:MFS transporter n=1 Tax=Sporolactobacillus laevolacticus TaxID=33018 RepID=UPI0025B569FC|nr:MFS transporter [Sporolactobacillus laevolacticus]MDN3955845.1 MFS transporter [Sporolactobacillus laevolacticus]